MSEKVKNWFYAAGEIISAVWTVVSLLLDINGYTTKYDLRVVAIFGVVIFVVLMLIHIISKNNQLESKTPNIQIDGRINKVERGKSIIANVPFANNPKNRTLYNNANGVLAKITY